MGIINRELIMDSNIKKVIDSLKDAIISNFKIDAEMQKKIDALFTEIEKLGIKFKDVGKFEAEFQKSPLNQKYVNLFTEIATKVAKEKSAKGAAVGAIESAFDQVIDNVVPTKAAVNQKVSDIARDIPVVGNAIDFVQKADYLGHLGRIFGKKK